MCKTCLGAPGRHCSTLPNVLRGPEVIHTRRHNGYRIAADDFHKSEEALSKKKKKKQLPFSPRLHRTVNSSWVKADELLESKLHNDDG